MVSQTDKAMNFSHVECWEILRIIKNRINYFLNLQKYCVLNSSIKNESNLKNSNNVLSFLNCLWGVAASEVDSLESGAEEADEEEATSTNTSKKSCFFWLLVFWIYGVIRLKKKIIAKG